MEVTELNRINLAEETPTAIAYEGFPYESNFVELPNGLNMHYLDEGTGDPIVLLHGQPTSAYLWRNIIPELAKRGRVIVPDMINFGLSDTTDEPQDYIEDQGAFFSQFIDVLELENVTLVGHDWGGPISLTYAVDNPDNIKAVAFMESFVVPFPDVSVVPAFPPEFVQAFWANAALSEANIISNNLLVEGWLFDPAFGGIATPLSDAEEAVYRAPFQSPESRDQLVISPQQLPILDPTGYPILDPDGPGGEPPTPVPNIEEFVGFANYLAAVDIPKLVVYGNPGFTSPELVMSLAGAVPDIELVEVGSEENPAFHFLQEDVPEELSAVLGDWLDSFEKPKPEPTIKTTLAVTVENLAPENGIGFAALWFGTHDGSFDLFDPGDTASSSLEFLVEDGLVGLEEAILPGILDDLIEAGLDINRLPISVQQAIDLGLDLPNIPPPPGTLAGDFLSSDSGQNGGTQGMVVTSIRTNPDLFDLLDDPSAFPQNVLDSITNPFFFIQASGETESFTVPLNGSPDQNRYFSFASMLFPTNDGFVANEDPLSIEIFDEQGRFQGANVVVTGAEAWDGGTEVNDEAPESLLYTFEVFGAGGDEGGTIQPFPGFKAVGEGGVLDYVFNGERVAENVNLIETGGDILRISIGAKREGNRLNNRIEGGVGDDTLLGRGSNDTLKGRGGDDLLRGGNGQDRLLGQGGNDKLLGGKGRDRLLGGTGADILTGGDGNDWLEGGHGHDRMKGGRGKDTFVIADQFGFDTVVDFRDGVDKLGLKDLVFDDLEIQQVGTRTTIRVADSDALLVQVLNQNAALITATDFRKL